MRSDAQAQREPLLEPDSALRAIPGYTIRYDSHGEALNAAICAGFAACAEHASRRTHCFAGRFENIYIDAARIPALAPLLARAQACA
ncbi:MAG: hypothetical protein ACYC7I_04945, partial [Gammaproteobacteria bacterium]